MNLEADRMNRTNIMIDIETLGTGVDAVVLSIGAVAFSFDSFKAKDFTPDRLDQDGFYIVLDARAQKDRRIDASTVYWWFDQTEGSREAVMPTNCTPKFALEKLWEWWPKESVNQRGDLEPRRDLNVWAKPPSFDLAILHSLWSGDVLWERRNECDLRTLLKLAYGSNPDDLEDGSLVHRNEAKHNAKADAVAQATEAMMAWDWLTNPQYRGYQGWYPDKAGSGGYITLSHHEGAFFTPPEPASVSAKCPCSGTKRIAGVPGYEWYPCPNCTPIMLPDGVTNVPGFIRPPLDNDLARV